MTAEEFIALLDRTVGERGLIRMGAAIQPGWRVYAHLDLPPEMVPHAVEDRTPLVVLTPEGVDRIAALIRDIEQMAAH